MNTATQILIFIGAGVVTAVLVLITVSVLSTLNQLRSLMTDLEKTSVETRELTLKLHEVTEKVNRDVDKVDGILEASKETVTLVTNSAKLINKSFLTKSAGFLTILPAIKMGWNLVKKFKGGK